MFFEKNSFFSKKVLTFPFKSCILSLVAEIQQQTDKIKYAGMAELADAQASGACGSNIVWVQVPLPALFFCLFTGLPFGNPDCFLFFNNKRFLTHFRIIPVQIRLFFGKQMEIIHLFCDTIQIPRFRLRYCLFFFKPAAKDNKAPVITKISERLNTSLRSFSHFTLKLK